jgi:hypothetical protein
MGRRASTKVNYGVIGGVAVGVVFLAVVGFLIFGSESSELDKVTSFPASEWIDSGGRSYAGGLYRLEGKLENRFLRGSEEIASIAVDTDRGERFVPVRIPQQAKKVNLERNSSYAILVKVDQDGFPVAQDIRNR